MFVHVSIHVCNLDVLQWSHLKKNSLNSIPATTEHLTNEWLLGFFWLTAAFSLSSLL